MNAASFDVLLTREAERDLGEIWQCMAEVEAVERAEQVIRALEAKVLSLADFPRRGTVIGELADIRGREYREIHITPYRVFYAVMAGVIVVNSILAGRRDVASELQRRLLR